MFAFTLHGSIDKPTLVLPHAACIDNLHQGCVCVTEVAAHLRLALSKHLALSSSRQAHNSQALQAQPVLQQQMRASLGQMQ